MIDELVDMHPVLLGAILKGAGGIIGEHLVAQALTERGHKVQILANNSRERDLIVGDHTVEVKSVRGRTTWFVRKRPSRADIWILVRMPKFDDVPIPTLDQVEFFVFHLEELQRLWDDNPWNAAHPTNGDIRPKQVGEVHRDSWHKIGG